LFALEEAARAAAAQTFNKPMDAHAHLSIPATVQSIKTAVGVKSLAEVLPAVAAAKQ
jgi:hypothetical protein